MSAQPEVAGWMTPQINSWRPRTSPVLNELGAALAKAQAAMKPAVKDASNPYFKSKYADLTSVWEACREALTSNGLAIVQSPIGHGDSIGVTTTLLHASGQHIESTITVVLEDPTPQAVGSALTYLRRYALAAMVGVAPDDDDGNDAQPKGNRPANDNGRPRPAPSPSHPPAGDAPVPAPLPSLVSLWTEYDALRDSMGVSPADALERVGKFLKKKVVKIDHLSYEELARVVAKMRETAGDGNV